MKLTQEQLDFFDTFGYLMIRQLFSQDETDKIIQGFEWSIQNCAGGKNHDGSTRTMFLGPIEHHPDMCRLVDHPSILGLSEVFWEKISTTAAATAIIIAAIPAGILTEVGGSYSPPKQPSISIRLHATPGHCA